MTNEQIINTLEIASKSTDNVAMKLLLIYASEKIENLSNQVNNLKQDVDSYRNDLGLPPVYTNKE